MAFPCLGEGIRSLAGIRGDTACGNVPSDFGKIRGQGWTASDDQQVAMPCEGSCGLMFFEVGQLESFLSLACVLGAYQHAGSIPYEEG